MLLMTRPSAAGITGHVSHERKPAINYFVSVQVLAGAFPQEDADIDARPYAFPEGDKDEDFKGFHKIERSLFRFSYCLCTFPGMSKPACFPQRSTHVVN